MANVEVTTRVPSEIDTAKVRARTTDVADEISQAVCIDTASAEGAAPNLTAFPALVAALTSAISVGFTVRPLLATGVRSTRVEVNPTTDTQLVDNDPTRLGVQLVSDVLVRLAFDEATGVGSFQLRPEQPFQPPSGIRVTSLINARMPSGTSGTVEVLEYF